MTRYCGQCGMVLVPSSLQSGRCASCGAEIDPALATFDARATLLAENPPWVAVQPGTSTPPEATSDLAGIGDGRYGSSHTTTPGEQFVWLPRQPERQESPRVFWTLALLAAAALLVAVIGLFFLVQHGPLATVFSPVTPSGSTVSSGLPASGATGTSQSTRPASRKATATPGGGRQPTPTLATSSPTVTPTKVATPTSAVTPPRLSVLPLTITMAVCHTMLPTTKTITITNVGGKNLNWRASAAVGGYVIVPGFGTIGPGLHQTVSVQKISKSGTVTVSSSNGTNSPQKVSIKCDQVIP